MYIYENHCNRTRITIRKPSFSSAELRHGEIQVSSNGMNKRTLLVVPYVLRIPSLKYPNIEFHSKTIKHFALQAFFLVPHFSSAMHFVFFFELFNPLKLSGTEGHEQKLLMHSGNNANNSFHFPRDAKSAAL